MLKKINTEPMDEAYKLLGGDPAGDAVSVAAKGGVPETDDEQRMRTMGKTDKTEVTAQMCTDIEDAYAKLFEGLAGIMRYRGKSA